MNGDEIRCGFCLTPQSSVEGGTLFVGLEACICSACLQRALESAENNANRRDSEEVSTVRMPSISSAYLRELAQMGEKLCHTEPFTPQYVKWLARVDLVMKSIDCSWLTHHRRPSWSSLAALIRTVFKDVQQVHAEDVQHICRQLLKVADRLESEGR